MRWLTLEQVPINLEELADKIAGAVPKFGPAEHFVHFFASAETGRRWTAAHPGTFLLTLDDAFALGRLVNARNFEEVLR